MEREGEPGAVASGEPEGVSVATTRSDALAVICGMAGAAIVALSFVTWMEIVFTETIVRGETDTYEAVIKGTDASALTTVGDGYLTAALGLLAIGLAIAFRFVGRWGYYCAAGLALSGLLSAMIGLYNIVYDRGTSSAGALGISVQVEVSRSPGLWALTVSAVILTIAAFALLTLAWRRVAPVEDAEEAEGAA
jgi:hypothetical protein